MGGGEKGRQTIQEKGLGDKSPLLQAYSKSWYESEMFKPYLLALLIKCDCFIFSFSLRISISAEMFSIAFILATCR